MEIQTVTIADITRTMTTDDVIRMVLQSDTPCLSEYALFYVKGDKEKHVKSSVHLHKLLAESTDNIILTVKKRVKTKAKRSTVYKAKKTLMRLKNIFARETVGRQNNLNFTTSKNLENGGAVISKCSGEKLTAIENLLQSQTILITEDRKAEVKGKVELFRRFMNDINDSMADIKPSEDTYDDNIASFEISSDITRLSSKLNEAFVRQPAEVSLLNNAILHTTTLQDTVLDQDITELMTANATDLFNECIVFNESYDMSESAFGDDNDVGDLERNVFDEDFEPNGEDIRNFFDKSLTESTDDAIDSFMISVARNDDHDEGLSSLGSDFTSD